MQPEPGMSHRWLSGQTVHNCRDMVQSFSFPGWLWVVLFNVYSFLSFLLILLLPVFFFFSEGMDCGY